MLLAWSVLLFGVLRRGETVKLEIVLRRQHYLQAFLQGSLILYWGYYWREVYHAAPLIVAQLLFAYGFDSLLSWTHRRTYALGFGSFPIIFSITLFFWFKDPFFYWQFVMVAIGLTAKEFLRWKRDGINTHIFNPSSFPLAVVSVALLLADATDMTWGFSIAQTEFYPPHIYLALFLIALPGQFLFGVTPMTFAAVTTTFVFSQLYYAVTGSYFFVDAHVPIAVFIGMNLLFTDPATSPRTLVGRILFGVLYGLSTVLLYDLLLSRTSRVLRQAAASAAAEPVRHRCSTGSRDRRMLKALDPSTWSRDWLPYRRHLAYMSVWAVAFGAMSASGVHRRRASGAVDAVLGTGMHGRQARRVPQPLLPARRLLRRRFRVVVQRDRHHARGALRQSLAGRGRIQARVHAAIRGRLRQRNGSRDGRHAAPRRADRARLPVHPARQQGPASRRTARAALRARVRARLAGHLRPDLVPKLSRSSRGSRKRRTGATAPA